MIKNISKIITLSLVASTFALGANIPTSGDIQRQVEKPKFEEQEKALPNVAKEYKAPLVIDDKVTTLVKEFNMGSEAVANKKAAKKAKTDAKKAAAQAAKAQAESAEEAE